MQKNSINSRIIIPGSEEQKKEKARSISLKEGASANASVVFGDNYLSLFALELKAQPFYIGAISALAGIITPLFQFFGTILIEHKKRKSLVLRFAYLQASMWIFIALLSYFAWKGLSPTITLSILLIGYIFILSFSGLSYSPWFSWMGDIINEKERGRYFAKRHDIAEMVGIVLFLGAGFLLDAFKTSGALILGFTVLFMLSSATRFISYLLLKKQYEPSFKLPSNYYFSFWSFLKRMDNYGKFAVSYGLFNFAIMVASPFFAVYMKQELNFSYTTLTLITLSSGIFYIIFAPLAGRFSDRFGNRTLFYISSLLFAINPILWIFIKSPLALILVPQLIVGLANAALIIAISNFTYDSVKPEHRSLCSSYTNILGGIGIVIGSLLGGIMLSYVHLQFAKPFVALFILAAILRLSIPLFFISQLKEVKKVDSLPRIHLNLAHPVKTIHSEIHFIKEILSNKYRKV